MDQSTNSWRLPFHWPHLQGLTVLASDDLANRVAAGRYQENGSRKPADFLPSSLKLSHAEATNRLRLAQKVWP